MAFSIKVQLTNSKRILLITFYYPNRLLLIPIFRFKGIKLKSKQTNKKVTTHAQFGLIQSFNTKIKLTNIRISLISDNVYCLKSIQFSKDSKFIYLFTIIILSLSGGVLETVFH